MGDVRGARHLDAARGVRSRRAARRRGDRDARALPVALKSVVLYHAEGCHLCERAREQLARVRSELPFAYTEVDITGDDALEARYRELLPVVEIDGERAFVYYVDEAAFRRKVG
ncbi:MAG TPA: glutaredoxin family protein [Gaiellaceae bacterium]|nr:glutaredoxin family protein [Gaiellaceae bacterium]